MRPHLLRPLLVLVFLVALNCWLNFWSIVGGESHLELMFWPWKLGISFVLAALVTRLTAVYAGVGRPDSASIGRLTILIALVMVIAGVVTYYYHVNEPNDEDDSGDGPAITRTHHPLTPMWLGLQPALLIKKHRPTHVSGAEYSGAHVPR